MNILNPEQAAFIEAIRKNYGISGQRTEKETWFSTVELTTKEALEKNQLPPILETREAIRIFAEALTITSGFTPDIVEYLVLACEYGFMEKTLRNMIRGYLDNSENTQDPESAISACLDLIKDHCRVLKQNVNSNPIHFYLLFSAAVDQIDTTLPDVHPVKKTSLFQDLKLPAEHVSLLTDWDILTIKRD